MEPNQTTETPRVAVDLVIFTLLHDTEVSMLDEFGFVSQGRKSESRITSGRSLFVVTSDSDFDSSAATEGGRVLPGGLVHPSERVEQAAHRIARETLGLNFKGRMRQMRIFDDPTRDPSRRTFSIPYWTFVEFADLKPLLGGKTRVGLELVTGHAFMNEFEESNQVALDDFDGVSRFGYRLMPSARLGRGHLKFLPSYQGQHILQLDHDEMVFYAWRALRHAFDGKLDPFNYLGLKPLGDTFRLSDIQEFYEACSGSYVMRDTFRRYLQSKASFLTPTDFTDNLRPGKPAKLYRAPEVTFDAMQSFSAKSDTNNETPPIPL